MNPNIVLSAHLSSLFASGAHVNAIVVPTARRDLPLSQSNRHAIPDGHASHSSLFYHPLTGRILLRVVQGDLAVELISLSASVPPIRFVFPAPVLPTPSLIVWQETHLHIVAVTTVGCVHRIILTISDESQLWHGHMRKDWCREFQLTRFSLSQISLCYIQDFHTVILGLKNGGCIRLFSDFIDDEQCDETWLETEYRVNNWYTSFLPQLSTDSSNPAALVAMSSLPAPTDVTDVFSLSRDRCLRRWTVAKGYRQEITLNAPSGMSPGNEKSTNLLPNEPQKLLQVYRMNIHESAVDDQAILVFLPTPNSTAAGGVFESYILQGNSWGHTDSCLCSKASIHARLQDFLLSSEFLYVLWEKQGQPLLEFTRYSRHDTRSEWHTIPWGSQAELTQAHLDELMLAPGSLADKYLQAILRPGVFSPYTLRSAISEYTEHYLSLPGQRHSALVGTYTTVAEQITAVVGCTVELARDHQTGFQQHQQYWTALRRDWEGFIARCRELERSARWPLALGVGDMSGEIIIAERERLGRCTVEDVPMRMHRLLANSVPVEPVYAFLDVCWTLRAKLSPQFVRQIDVEVQNVISQEVAFPLADIIVEASNRTFGRETIDEGLESWVTSRLTSIDDLDQSIRTILDIIGGLDQAVKREEDEVELILPPPISEWSRALIASYVCISVEVRYELCLTLAIMLFFLSDSLSHYDPALLAEIFAVFRGVTMLRSLCRQPAGDPDGATPLSQDSISGSPSSDDVVARLNNLHMSRSSQNPTPTFSLLYSLLVKNSRTTVIPAAAHHFIDHTGLLSTVSPSQATKSEVAICERLRTLGYYETAEQMVAWLPRTPAVCYILGRLGIALGRGDESALIFQGIAGCFGADGAISAEDREALAGILPDARLFTSEFEFYLHIADIFRAASLTAHELQYSKYALLCAPQGVDTIEIWAALFKGYTDLGLFEDAYMVLVTSPYEELKKLCIAQLVYSMCEGGSTDRLICLNTGNMAAEIEEALFFKVRNTDPRVAPFYSQILYTWYISREDYRNAAMAMYLRARKLAEIPPDRTQALSIMEDQSEALLVAANSLSLAEGKNPWVVVSLNNGEQSESRKRRKLNSDIPDYKFALEHRDVDVVTLNDMQNERIMLSAHTALLRKDPSTITGDQFKSPRVAVDKLIQAGLFDMAMYTASTLQVDMTELFQRLTIECLRLSAAQDTSLLEVAADWLLTDKVSSWPGKPAERGWRYLRQSLEQYDTVATDFKYSQAVFETLLSHDSSSPPPTWLAQLLEEYHPEYLIRTYLRYGFLESALDHTLTLTRKEKPMTSKRHACKTWLPYSLIDAVLKSVADDPACGTSSRAAGLLRTLQAELYGRLSQIRKESQNITQVM